MVQKFNTNHPNLRVQLPPQQYPATNTFKGLLVVGLSAFSNVLLKFFFFFKHLTVRLHFSGKSLCSFLLQDVPTKYSRELNVSPQFYSLPTACWKPPPGGILLLSCLVDHSRMLAQMALLWPDPAQSSSALLLTVLFHKGITMGAALRASFGVWLHLIIPYQELSS